MQQKIAPLTCPCHHQQYTFVYTTYLPPSPPITTGNVAPDSQPTHPTTSNATLESAQNHTAATGSVASGSEPQQDTQPFPPKVGSTALNNSPTPPHFYHPGRAAVSDVTTNHSKVSCSGGGAGSNLQNAVVPLLLVLKPSKRRSRCWPPSYLSVATTNHNQAGRQAPASSGQQAAAPSSGSTHQKT